MPTDLIRERTGVAPFIKPVLEALDQMQRRATLEPSPLMARARRVLEASFGSDDAPEEASFAHGSTGLLAEHTHYFEGFALLLSLPLGAAVAVRRTAEPRSRVVFEGSDAHWAFVATGTPRTAAHGANCPAWARLVEEVVQRMGAPGVQVDVAVVSTVRASCPDAYFSALGVALARALQATFSRSDRPEHVRRLVREAVIQATGAPFSEAYLQAADVGRPEAFSLIDVATHERLPLEAPGPDVLGWALVDVGLDGGRDAAFFRKRQAMADEALATLQRKGFIRLKSLRELEHRDLGQALDVLPRRLRPILRHLVSENRRIHRLITAVRRRDWQMFGALLLMSHASQRNDWGSTPEAADAAVEVVEQMSIDGMHGACMTGRGGCVLVVGQPFIVPQCLDRIQSVVRERVGQTPETVML